MLKRKASFTVKPQLKRQKTITWPPVTKRNALIGTEKKFNDVTTNTDATTTPVILDLNNFAAGDTALLRDGNRILCTSIQIRGSFSLESLAGNAIIRYMVIHDKNANGTAPTGLQVMENSVGITSMKNIANASRFTTLCDKVIVVNNTSDTAGAFAKAYVQEYIKIPQHLQLSQYADGTADVPISGSLSLIYYSDIVAGAADVDANWTVRLRFIG